MAAQNWQNATLPLEIALIVVIFLLAIVVAAPRGSSD